MIIAYLAQPVHADEGGIGEGGVIVGTLGQHEVGLAVDVGVTQLLVVHHRLIEGGGNRFELVQVDLGHGAVVGPLRNLRIVVLHQDGGGFLRGNQHGILGHHVAAGDRHILHVDVVLLAEVLLNPAGPVVVIHGGVADLGPVVHRDRDLDALRKGLPVRGNVRRGEGREAQQQAERQEQRNEFLHGSFPPFFYFRAFSP